MSKIPADCKSREELDEYLQRFYDNADVGLVKK